jgi:hypothetical protein
VRASKGHVVLLGQTVLLETLVLPCTGLCRPASSDYGGSCATHAIAVCRSSTPGNVSSTGNGFTVALPPGVYVTNPQAAVVPGSNSPNGKGLLLPQCNDYKQPIVSPVAVPSLHQVTLSCQRAHACFAFHALQLLACHDVD